MFIIQKDSIPIFIHNHLSNILEEFMDYCIFQYITLKEYGTKIKQASISSYKLYQLNIETHRVEKVYDFDLSYGIFQNKQDPYDIKHVQNIEKIEMFQNLLTSICIDYIKQDVQKYKKMLQEQKEKEEALKKENDNLKTDIVHYEKDLKMYKKLKETKNIPSIFEKKFAIFELIEEDSSLTYLDKVKAYIKLLNE